MLFVLFKVSPAGIALGHHFLVEPQKRPNASGRRKTLNHKINAFCLYPKVKQNSCRNPLRSNLVRNF